MLRRGKLNNYKSRNRSLPRPHVPHVPHVPHEQHKMRPRPQMRPPPNITGRIRRDTAFFSWGAQRIKRDRCPTFVRSRNVYYYDKKGNKYLDFNSSAMCSNLGHTIPKPVIRSINKQMRQLPYIHPCYMNCPIKKDFSRYLASIMPGDINKFYFGSGGAEVNEAAIVMARKFTGKYKILSRYRSYHGSTPGTLAMSGDPRRWHQINNNDGFIKFHGPTPHSFTFGNNEEEITKRSLEYLWETIEHENPDSIAAIFLECITGTNGILKPTKGYLEGVRALCDKYNILLAADEVMTGFGRTGKLFGYMHSDITPDLVTMAKGLTSGWLPLGALGVRDHIADHFEENPIGIGSTYNSHPVTLACANSTLKYFFDNKILDNVVNLEPYFLQELERVAEKHNSVFQARGMGFFGIMELAKDREGTPFEENTLMKFDDTLLKNGIFTVRNGSAVFTNPPLICTKDQLKEGFEKIDKSLEILNHIKA